MRFARLLVGRLNARYANRDAQDGQHSRLVLPSTVSSAMMGELGFPISEER